MNAYALAAGVIIASFIIAAAITHLFTRDND